MATFTRGSNVVLDETAGLQNATATPAPAGDADDNDITLPSSGTVFDALSPFGNVTATKAALSGYTGANTGTNAFTVSPAAGGAITDLGFVGPDGLALNGLDSGLLTLDGRKIFLYTGTNNNVVVGRVGTAGGLADSGGTVAFAGYIEETLTSGAITGGKIWLTEYQPLKHPVTTNADDPLNLDGKVFVGVSQDQNFSLAGAPSGQQLFLMFSTQGAAQNPDANGRIPGVSIIVTGKDPLNQSASSSAVTAGDTVNSSQGGGNTTLGTNNQGVTEQEGLRFSFVTGAKADVTIPNLSPGEAGLESNIDFTQYFGARSATFQIVQEVGGDTAMIKLTAFKNADNVAGSQSGVNFIDSYANDATEKVAITNGSVTVTTLTGGAIAGVVVTYNADGTALITGVPTDSQVTYRTAADHNRVLVENAGALDAKGGDKTHADFDIGGFKVLQSSTDKQEIGSQMVFEDDGPSVAFGNLVGTGTDRMQFGFWSKAAGVDGANASDLQIALTGFQLSGVAQTGTGAFTLTEGSSSPDGNGNYNWSGTLTGDFDNNPNTPVTTLTFTLVAQPDGKYALKLATPVQSTTITDTANGALGAGGPDPVQTLNIPSTSSSPAETVVFFSAKISALGSDIAAGVISGATDPTEASLQGNNPPSTLAAFIDPRSMNVSTAGIGVDNNNMNGYGASGASAIIDDPDGAAGNTPADDSFVVNPLGLADKVRVFIDNSVTGYDYTGGERLQYRVIFADNTVSNYTTVVGDLGKGSLPKFFEIDGGGKKIDAVQLTMLYGEIKIPNIQFLTVNEGLAKDIGLDFSASLTDKDGDTATDLFSADLFTNKAASAAFDFELLGTANAPDAFDVELPGARDDYKITGFDTTTGARDKIVLLGAAVPEAQREVIITNGPGATDDSIVTVKENGTTTATLTVVGVDLVATDIVFA